MKKIGGLIILTGLIVFFIYQGLKKADEHKPLRHLPMLGNHQVTTNSLGGSDTVFHSIAKFSFTDQQGKTVTEKTFTDKIYVADYFFCTCQSICPVMTKQMGRVADAFKNDAEVKFISHTVNPEHDSVNVLADYARANNVRYGQWYLVTGPKPELYQLARESYLLDASEGNGGEEDFIHTQNFALIDKEKRIRGYYDGTDSLSVNELINDIALLKREYHAADLP